LHAFPDVAATGYGYRGLGSYSNFWQTIKDMRPLRPRQELVYLPTWYLQLQLATPRLSTNWKFDGFASKKGKIKPTINI